MRRRGKLIPRGGGNQNVASVFVSIEVGYISGRACKRGREDLEAGFYGICIMVTLSNAVKILVQYGVVRHGNSGAHYPVNIWLRKYSHRL